MKKSIIGALIVLSGVFYYKTILPGYFYQSQYSLFIFCGGVMLSIVLFKKNKWIGCLAALASFSFLKSYLFMLGPKYELFETSLVGIMIFGTYYASRQLNLKEDVLKWVLIPVVFNMVLVYVQAFDHTGNFMTVDGISGFLGSRGATGCFLALSTPLILLYAPVLYLFLLGAILICQTSVGMGMFIASSLVYIGIKNKKLFKIAIVVLLLLGIFLGVFLKGAILRESLDLQQRLCFWIGTLDGIKHNPIFGWGIGNFAPIWNNLLQGETRYFGVFSCNYTMVKGLEKIMNHPHNELLLWVWYMGVGVVLFFVLLCRDVIRSLTKENILPFSMLVAGFVCMMGYFLSYPTWFVLMITLGIYENQKEVKDG